MRQLPSLFVVAVALSGCGGGSSSSPTPSPSPAATGTETVTFTGIANPSCQGEGHIFEAADGALTLTLVATTDNVGLYGQVCAGGIDNNACTINQTRMAVGDTLSGPRRGGSSQSVKMLTLNCGPGPAPAGPVSYTIRLTYPR